MSTIPERIATRRLLLRCWDPADAPALRAAIDGSLAELREWLVWAVAEPTPVEELAIRLEAFAARFRSSTAYTGPAGNAARKACNRSAKPDGPPSA